jgi:type IV secretion system protein VirD4
VKLGKKYSSKNLTDNILLTEHFKISFDSYKHRRNLNVLVIGGSGSGKTRFYAKPNIMQCNCSFLITDPKAELLRSTGHLLRENGYVRVFDLINMSESYCYNPFRYIRDDKDVLKLVTNLIRNTTPKTAGNIDPFWEKSETALLQALILYLYHEAPEEEQNFTMVMEMLSSAEVREEDESFASPLDLLLNGLI